MSAFVMITVQQISVISTILPNNYLIRAYKSCHTDDERQQLIKISTTGRFFTSVIAFSVLVLAALHWNTQHGWGMAVAAGIPLIPISACNPSWVLQAQENQVAQYKIDFLASLVTLGIYISVFRPGAQAWTHVLISLASGVIVFVMTWNASGYVQLHKYIKVRALYSLVPMIKKSFPIYVSGILVLGYNTLEIPLIGYLTSVRELGLYRSALSLIGGMKTLLSLVPILLYPRFIEWNKQGPDVLWERQIRLCGLFAILGCVVLIPTFILSPIIYPILYGANFAAAALPFSLLMTSKVLVLMNGLFAYGLWSQGRDRLMLMIIGFTCILSVGVNLVIIPRYGITGAAGVNVMSEFTILLLTVLFSKRLMARTTNEG